MIATTIASISKLRDLRPSQTVNNLFSRLVQQVIEAPPNMSFSEVQCSIVQNQAASAEQELELAWARKIATSSTPLSAISEFPYYTNYQELVRRELTLLDSSGLVLERGNSALIIGSGPLPLTACELAKQRSVTVSHVDASSAALAACEEICSAVGLVSECLEGKGQSIVLSERYDLILVAALAGSTINEKQAIINNILSSLAPGGRVLVRSARGARALLYPAFEATVFSGVRLLEEYHPDDEIINSVFIYEAAQ